MENFIKIAELKPGMVLIKRTESYKRDYPIYKVEENCVLVTCPSGAIRSFNEIEINETFHSIWNN